MYKIARSAANTFENIADELMTELERAELCPASQVPPNVVRMQSIVRFVTDTGKRIGSGAFQLSDLGSRPGQSENKLQGQVRR